MHKQKPAPDGAPRCAECGGLPLRSRILVLPAGGWEIACQGECHRARQRHWRKREWHAGPGFGVQRQYDPAKVAATVEKMQRGHLLWRQNRKTVEEWKGDLTGDLSPLVNAIGRRHWTVLLLHLGGWSNVEAARVTGYASEAVVRDILKRPHMRNLIARVREAQMERILSGDFGVKAQARGAAPRVMKEFIDQAGAGQDTTKKAAKPADVHKFGKTILEVAGELTMTHEHKHAHVHTLLHGMTKEELLALVTQRQWPERLRPTIEKLGLPSGEALG